MGFYEQARALVPNTLTVFSDVGDERGVARCHLSLGEVALAEEAFEEARELLDQSAALYRNVEQSNELCLALAALGHAEFRLGQIAQARRLLKEALCAAANMRDYGNTLFALAHTIPLLISDADAERAMEVYALAMEHPYICNSLWWRDVAGKHIEAAAAVLPPDVTVAAQKRGRERNLWETAEELLDELDL